MRQPSPPGSRLKIHTKNLQGCHLLWQTFPGFLIFN
jgi:hypothetical protein